MESKSVHLVCSSGGVRCFSYIGAVQKMLENNISIASVSACSMGTMLGAMICSGMKIDEIEKAVLSFDFKLLRTQKTFPLVRMWWYPYARNHTPDFAKIITSLIGKDITLGEMTIPFSAAALDIRQKRFLVYSSDTHPDMKISELIKIATAIPLLYAPYKMDKRLLIDAAVATESPIWIAANNPQQLPIVVLKTGSNPNENYRKGLGNFLGHLIKASTDSHDYFASTQTDRAIELNINCGDVYYANFKLTKDEIEYLILQGQLTAAQKLKEFNYDFNRIIGIQEIKTHSTKVSDDNLAELLADQMITGFQNEAARRNQVFVSYCSADKVWLQKLQTSLKSLERYAGIKAWDDTVIKPGNDWAKQIDNALVSTKVAVFLVTPDFLASDFIQDKEMKYFLEISEKENVPILWVAVKSSLYELSPLSKIECVNDPKIPLDTLEDADQNVVLTDICKKILLSVRGKQ